MEMNYLKGVSAGVLLTLMTACSGSDSSEMLPADKPQVRHLVITQVEADDTRATLTDAAETLAASWTKGDELTYCNVSGTMGVATPSLMFPTGTLTAAATAAMSRFTGDVTCMPGDFISVIYPAATVNETTKGYTITLSGQDGSLNTLAERYHYVYGVASVTGVSGKTATATMQPMKSLLTVCKFSFTDGTNVIPIVSLNISYGGSDSNTGKYPQTASVVCSDSQADVHAAGVATDNTGLTVTPAPETNEVYVALLPTQSNKTEFRFTVTNSSGTYTGVAKATLNEGEYVRATGLKLTKNL